MSHYQPSQGTLNSHATDTVAVFVHNSFNFLSFTPSLPPFIIFQLSYKTPPCTFPFPSIHVSSVKSQRREILNLTDRCWNTAQVFEHLLMESMVSYENDLNSLKATELTLGLPGTQEKEEKRNNNKRQLPQTSEDSVSISKTHPAPPAKEKIVGWPPIRSYRKNNLQEDDGIYVKVSMDGAPYLRKIDLKLYMGYPELLRALETMFKFTIGEYSEREGYKGSEYAPTYEDKDGDWMLLGDVPWDMFMTSCKRVRIMKGSEARGLGCGV
ncbi:hypothetical protein RJT34_24358 [Clitoria ternatea]|uniref:Auxin-induced protein n=1 Tax=Clitoria ternatea TaxID=43366 RepID=A0AAN9IJ60_CLITE